MEDDFDSVVNEALGMTNKSPEVVNVEFEKRILTQFPVVPNLTGANEDVLSQAVDSDVEIPQCVKDALDECIAKNAFPIDDDYLLWMEKKVAEHNGVDPSTICAHPEIRRKGKMWFSIPEVATRFTGFTYTP